MNWGIIFLITLIVVLITLFEWPKINKDQKKEKVAFAMFTGAAWLLAILLVFFPDMQGPNDWLEMIFGPIGKFLMGDV